MQQITLLRVRTVVVIVVGALLSAIASLAGAPSAQADPAGAQSQLVAVTGHGTGLVIISPTSSLGHGVFDAQVKVNIHDAAPNTSWTVTRAGDFPADGVCNPVVVGTVAHFETSAGGAGAVEFERTGAPSDFDLQVTVTGADGTVLQSGCMTIHIK